jgi:thiol oxidase
VIDPTDQLPKPDWAAHLSVTLSGAQRATRRMRRRFALIAALVGVLVATLAPECAAANAIAPSAIHLSEKDFDDRIAMTKADEHCLMEFFAPWCPHCQNFGPTYERIAALYNKGENWANPTEGHERPQPHVTVMSVDCVANGHLCSHFDVRGYPTVLFGKCGQFAKEHKARHSEKLEKISPNTDAEVMVNRVNEALNAEHELIPIPADDQKPPIADAEKKDVDVEAEAPHADLEDIEHATVLAYDQMTSAALLRPTARDSFVSFMRLMADAHPVAACKDGSRALMQRIDKQWPEHSKPADTDAFNKIRRQLADHRVCGDGHVGPLTWRQCEGSEEGKRGYTCGLWLLFHSLAARSVVPASSKNDYVGATWLATVSRWVENFFPCDDCRTHFIAMVNEADGVGKVATKTDGVLWSWRAHNRVNARLSEQESRGEAVGSGDPKFPKTQWPTRGLCPGCHTEDGNWDEDATAKFLVTYFHGLGAPRPRGPGSGKGGSGNMGVPRVGAGKRGDDASPGSGTETLFMLAVFAGVGYFAYGATNVPGSAGFRLRRQLARHLRATT